MSEVIAPKRPRRLRISIGMTVHPDTITRFDVLTDKYKMGRGQVVDKLVLALHTAVTSGKLTCVNGQYCQIGRTDVPPVL